MVRTTPWYLSLLTNSNVVDELILKTYNKARVLVSVAKKE